MKARRIVFCWTGLTGYMPACWRVLMERPDVEIRVFIEKRRANTQHAFSEASLAGIPCQVRDREERSDYADWLEQIEKFQPDLIEATGWHSRLSREVAWSPKLVRGPKILGLDLPYQKTLKQRMAPWLLKPYLRRYNAVCVSGERAAQYALYLGFEERQIERGLYGFDCDGFRVAKTLRENAPWPRRFIFVGRYCHDKGVDCLLSAYRIYRESALDPWGLSFCGKGELAERIRAEAGVDELGFVMPDKLPSVLALHGVFILPSRFEPWGVVLGEACAAGMPIIATTACGGSVELLRPYFNGLSVAKNDIESLVKAMQWMHGHESELRGMGNHAIDLAAPFDVKNWAYRWHEWSRKWGGR